MLRVTVALCTYNGAAFIREQLESILQQTRPPDELVVADDGSADDTISIVHAVFSAHGSQRTRLRVLTGGDRPLGVTGNFARAVAAATGDILVLSDQDDRWRPDRLSVAISAFERQPGIVLQHGDARLIDESGTSLGLTLFAALRLSRRERTEIEQGRAFAAYLRRNLATGATMAFRRSLLSAALPFPREWVHDEWLAIVAAATGEIGVLADPLVDYRQHDANEIGVTAATLGYRLGRVCEPRGDRLVRLSARAEELERRLAALDVNSEWLELARGKARFERTRARFAAVRILRIAPVLRLWSSGAYGRYSSQRGFDVIRDILQPA